MSTIAASPHREIITRLIPNLKQQEGRYLDRETVARRLVYMCARPRYAVFQPS